MSRATERLRVFFGTPTGRLATTYLAIIAVLTVVFSIVIFVASTSQFSRPIGPPREPSGYSQTTRQNVEDLFKQRSEQAKFRIFWSLVLLDIVTIGGGAALSILLARRTLLPIERAMHSQNRFVSDASHELRTPLTALQTTNEVALRRNKLSIAGAREVLRGNIEEVVKLRDLTSSLLTLASADKPTATTVVDVSKIISAGVSDIEQFARVKRVSIVVDSGEIMVRTDAAALSQLLKILLENAIKYSPNGGKIYVSAAHYAEMMRLEIRDEGPGIAPEFHQKIFERFFRIDSSRSARHVSGYGLGLAIAKQIAEKNGFDIAVESDGQNGSKFRVDIATA